MKRIQWNKIINALVLVKIGQDLGTNSQLTQSIHDMIDTLAEFFGVLAKLL